MENIKPPSSSIIPTVDLSPFFKEGHEQGRKKAMHIISEACTNLGVFQIKNHCLSEDMCVRLLNLHKKFSRHGEPVKKCSTCIDHEVSGAGYCKMSIDTFHDFEYVIMYSPENAHNGVPAIPHDYRKTFEEVYKYLLKTAQILEEIINDCLGLPRNFLKHYNDDRSEDLVMAMNYPPSDETGDIGIITHQDANLFTIVIEDEVGGVEILKNEDWIPVIPSTHKLLVVIGDCISVLTNKKYKNVTHRAFRHKGENRYAIDFIYSLAGKKWVEPLPKLIEETGGKPKYKGFYYKDYVDLKIKNDFLSNSINLTYYEI